MCQSCSLVPIVRCAVREALNGKECEQKLLQVHMCSDPSVCVVGKMMVNLPHTCVEQGKMAGPFQWDGHQNGRSFSVGWTSKWHSGTSQIKCFQVPFLHPNRILLRLASSSTGLALLLLMSPRHEDLSSIGFARLSIPQTPSTFQPKIRI